MHDPGVGVLVGYSYELQNDVPPAALLSLQPPASLCRFCPHHSANLFLLPQSPRRVGPSPPLLVPKFARRFADISLEDHAHVLAMLEASQFADLAQIQIRFNE